VSLAVKPEVATVLDQCRIEGNLLFLPDQLDRKLYMDVNKILDALGGKWNREERAHVFTVDPEERLDEALLTGQATHQRQEFQCFSTPAELAERLVEMAEIEKDHLVLEPSAGSGRIVNFICAEVHFCEIQDDLAEEVIQREGTGPGSWGLTRVGTDFLRYEPGPIYDRIVANPPFTKQQDITHVTHMLQLLTRGGILVSVMSNSITFRTNKKTQEFLKWINGKAESVEIIPLEAGVFSESGTQVNACILKIRW